MKTSLSENESKRKKKIDRNREFRWIIFFSSFPSVQLFVHDKRHYHKWTVKRLDVASMKFCFHRFQPECEWRKKKGAIGKLWKYYNYYVIFFFISSFFPSLPDPGKYHFRYKRRASSPNEIISFNYIRRKKWKPNSVPRERTKLRSIY